MGSTADRGQRTASDCSLGVFINCKWDYYADKLNMNGGGLSQPTKRVRNFRKVNEYIKWKRFNKVKVLPLREKNNILEIWKSIFFLNVKFFSPLSREGINHSDNLIPLSWMLPALPRATHTLTQCPATVVALRAHVYSKTVAQGPALLKDTLQFSRFSSKHTFFCREFFKIPPRKIF